jgi:hypothetical protein
MKKTLFSLLSILIVLSTSATDRIVEEFGISPTYSSISSAVAAAVDGDRIIIKNRAGNIPWIENITINKSLSLLSYDNNTQFVVQGNYTIGIAEGREVTIIGMKNTSGHIYSGFESAPIRTTKVNIMDCWFVSGTVVLDNFAYDTQFVGNKLDAGYCIISFGNVIGNEITSPTSSLAITNTMTFNNDTCFIVGNKFTSLTVGTNALAINASAQVYHVKNNLIYSNGSGIDLRAGNNSAVANQIWNNTIVAGTYTGTQHGIYFTATNNNSVWEVMNNVIDELSQGTTYGIYRHPTSNGQINVYYNVINSSFTNELLGLFTFEGNNIIDQTFALNPDGTLPPGNPAIDGGNPSGPFFDLDLTPGDAGAYGGSYTLDNFFPLLTGAARVYFVKFPFNVRQGTTLNIKAYGFDR